MIKKPSPKSTQLEQIQESTHVESTPTAATSLNNKRVSIATLMNKLSKEEKVERADHREELMQESKVEEKDRMIKELQEEILDKKLKNDMVQEAFQRRNQTEHSIATYSNYVKVLVEGCKLLALHDPSFKRSYFRSLLTILKLSAKSKNKAIKSLLIWTINWITRLFSFLSSTLIKK